MKKEYLKIGLTVLAVSLFLLLLIPSPGPAAEKVIKIGHVEGLTGPISAQADIFKGREDVFELLNKDGGIRGYKIKTLWSDTKYQLPAEISAYKRFVHQGAVAFLPCSTGASEQLKIMAKSYGVPIVFAVNSSIMRHPPGWSYPVFPTYGDCTAGLFDWILASHWKKSTPPKVAIIVTDTGYGRAVEEALPYMKSKGIEIVFTAYVSMTSIDLSPQVLQAEKAGADYIITNPLAEGKALIRDFKRLGLAKKGKFIVTPWPAGAGSLYPSIAKDASGFVIGSFQVVVPDCAGKFGLPTIDKMVKFNMDKYGFVQPVGLYWGCAADAAVTAEAIGKAIDAVGIKKLSGKEVRKQLEKMEMPASKTYNLTPDLKATPGKRGMMDKAYIAITKDGKWEAMAGWATMPNLQAWKEKHPEFYKK